MHKPDEIIASFKAHWTGTDTELNHAMYQLYLDIRSSYDLAMRGGPLAVPSEAKMADVHRTVDDYYLNHYTE